MANKLLIVVCFFSAVIAIPTKAQQSRFPIKESSVWRMFNGLYCYDEECGELIGNEDYIYFVSGDTLIGGKSYHKLYKSGIMYLETPLIIKNKYKGAIRDSMNRIYYVEDKKEKERMLYNFDARSGERICPEWGGMDYQVSEIDTLENGRKRFIIDMITVHCGSANTVIEGIGWIGGLLEGNSCYFHPGISGSNLLCYSEEGMPVFQTSELWGESKIEECDLNFVSSKIMRQVPSLEITEMSEGFLEICVPDGNIGLYQVDIFTDNGQRVFKKEVQLPGIIDCSILGSGLFILKVSDGKVVSVGKVRLK